MKETCQYHRCREKAERKLKAMGKHVYVCNGHRDEVAHNLALLSKVEGSHISMKKAATVMGISHHTLKAWIQSRNFPARSMFEVGGKTRWGVRIDDMARWLRKHDYWGPGITLADLKEVIRLRASG